MPERRLNLGSGDDVRSGGWINVDLYPPDEYEATNDPECSLTRGATLRWDLNERWPWNDNTFEEIYASHIVEHLRDKLHVIGELWRVAKHGARITVETPDPRNPHLWDDPTHCTPYGSLTFHYFATDPADLRSQWGYRMSPARFRIIEWQHDAHQDQIVWVLEAVKETTETKGDTGYAEHT